MNVKFTLLLLFGCCAFAQDRFHVYVGDLGPHHALVAWGTTAGPDNSIGRGAASMGKAVLTVGTQRVETDRAWGQVEGLEADREYEYTLSLEGKQVAQGRLRTWAEKADKAAFLVFGDWGNGSEEQREVAAAMARLVAERAGGANPIRFVLSTGDNIYSVVPGVFLAGSGDRDQDWEPRFFAPYAPILKSIPFYISLGNHDGNESEKRGDLALQLDNFFFPGNQPARWYRFHYADLIDIVALDSTSNTETGKKHPMYTPEGEQYRWAQKQFAELGRPWRIAFMHHPIFNGGPRHQKESNEKRMGHFVDLFAQGKLQAVFQGHEHNFQVSELNERSRNIRFFVTGAGGELRDKDIRKSMAARNIAGWAPQRHFLLVEIVDGEMRVTPMRTGPIPVLRPDGSAMPLPIVIKHP